MTVEGINQAMELTRNTTAAANPMTATTHTRPFLAPDFFSIWDGSYNKIDVLSSKKFMKILRMRLCAELDLPSERRIET
jgi:hypothetical protein